MYWFLGLKFSEDIYVDVYDWVNNKKNFYYLICVLKFIYCICFVYFFILNDFILEIIYLFVWIY